MLTMQASKGLNIKYVGILISPNLGCAKINLANFFCNTLALALAKFFPGENFPLCGIAMYSTCRVIYPNFETLVSKYVGATAKQSYFSKCTPLLWSMTCIKATIKNNSNKNYVE